jgi:hypothetical protein
METPLEFKPSTELLTFLKLNQLQTLSEVLSISDEELLSMRGFSYRILKEILALRKF